MNHITKQPLSSLGYNFIAKEFIPKGKNEYHLRNLQNRSGIRYRKLTPGEITVLTRNKNSSDNWNNVLVAQAFDPQLVKNCSFFGLVRIGKLEPWFMEFNNLRMPVGLYNSTIISCDIGDNVVIDNVNFLSHYILGNEVMLVNVNELATTDHSKFGNGVLKEGESESVRVWMEVCNENAGRKVLPFNGMLCADAWIWSKFRDDKNLLQKFREFTDKKFDTRRGYYGKIGDRTVIKNSRIIKDVWIGSDAYIKGANKLKNLTINSSADAKSQIGEGCELVNGVVGFGCRIFYGVKAVRFMMGSNSQLKYGARLINSFLGDNSTISCCEVLNSLIFPAHEQHHNNSFLCAATVMGQSNMAAGATVGSNHNSRGADGEIVAGRGFWPGLCVSLKHNSKFASFTLIAKGDFPAELNIPIPFSLVSNDVHNDRLLVMPAYWFMYNMYALSRNAGKYQSRDKRVNKDQLIEYDFVAPDSINEVFDALAILEKQTGRAWALKNKKSIKEEQLAKTGAGLLQNKPETVQLLEILATGFENSNRKTVILKADRAWTIFNELVVYYGMQELIRQAEEKKFKSWEKFKASLPQNAERGQWVNTGGQLMPAASLQQLLRQIKNGKVGGWDDMHAFYTRKSDEYGKDKLGHAYASLLEITGLSHSRFTKSKFRELLDSVLAIKQKMVENIRWSRARDYDNPFRQMTYNNFTEMNEVIGGLADNPFINQQESEFQLFTETVNKLKQLFR